MRELYVVQCKWNSRKKYFTFNQSIPYTTVTQKRSYCHCHGPVICSNYSSSASVRQCRHHVMASCA